MPKHDIPSYEAFMNPVIHALKSLGGSGTIKEINNKELGLGIKVETLEVENVTIQKDWLLSI